jgi:arylsulfatase A-like enzyme
VVIKMRVLYIDIDTLRPDHMGAYGYSRNTTPNLDEVEKDGFVFDKFYTSDAPCLPSRAALVSGQFGIHTGLVSHGNTAADRRIPGQGRSFKDFSERDNLFFTLQKAGLRTASISSFAERHSSWWFNAGVVEAYDIGQGGVESAEHVIPIAMDWLKRNENRDDWFLHLHLWDPHTPYRAPAEFGNPFANVPLHSDWITEEVLQQHLMKPGPHGAQDINGMDDGMNPDFPRHPGSVKNLAEVKEFIDNYDCGIAYADMMLGKVFDELRRQGIYDDTAIIISSDHGENMGELGLYAEHGTADEITCRIPMIIKWPGMKTGRDSALRYNIDLLPTLAELLGVEVSDKWDGESFAACLTGEGEAPVRESIVLSQQAHVCQRSARFGDWIYIRTVHDGFQFFPTEMLFNIKDDPHEQYNLAEKYPDICSKGARIILDWIDEKMKTADVPVDPQWTVYHEGGPFHAHESARMQYASRLEATGRKEAADALLARKATPQR